VRLSSTVRSPDWITAEYNNQNSPSTFYSISTASSSGSSAATLLHWLVSDQLGTPRMIFDQSGALANVSRHDYLPFGEELFANQGGRTTTQGYNASDGVRQQFTQKERDTETGLDYFEARYYRSAQGRFTSADSFAGSITNPQSLNLYSYVLGNPLRFKDPSGHLAVGGISDIEDWWRYRRVGGYFLGRAPLKSYSLCGPGCGSGQQDPNKPSLPPAVAPAGVPDIPEGTVGTATVTEWHPIPPRKGFWQRVKEFFGFGVAAGSVTWGDPSSLQDHFERHGADFGSRNAEEYAQQAQKFFMRSQQEGFDTTIDRFGVIRTYDPETNTFGSYNMDGTTKTFFRPSWMKLMRRSYWLSTRIRNGGRSPWMPEEMVESEIEPEIEIPIEPIP